MELEQLFQSFQNDILKKKLKSYLFAVLLDKFKHKASVNQWKKVKQEEGKTRVQPLR